MLLITQEYKASVIQELKKIVKSRWYIGIFWNRILKVKYNFRNRYLTPDWLFKVVTFDGTLKQPFKCSYIELPLILLYRGLTEILKFPN